MKIARNLDVKVFDKTLYAKVTEIYNGKMTKKRAQYCVRMGAFHTLCSFLGTI